MIVFLYSLMGAPFDTNGAPGQLNGTNGTFSNNGTLNNNGTFSNNTTNGTTNGTTTETETEKNYAELASFYVAIVFIPGLLILFVACRYVPDFFYKMCSEA